MSLFSVPLTVTRSQKIKAPIDEVFNLVVSFKSMEAWSPWFVMEPGVKIRHRGTDGAVGSVHIWEGEILGAGELEITKIEPGQKIEADLSILKPWKSQSKVFYDFKTQGDMTEVSWSMTGSLPLFMGWMRKSMEAWIGMDYERGLNMLKEYAETGEVCSHVEVKSTQESTGFNYIGVNTKCTIETVGEAMARDFESLETYMKNHDIHTSGTAFSIYHSFDMVKRNCHYTSGVSTKLSRDVSAGFVTGRVNGGKALVIEHTGSYQNLGNAWTAGYSLIRARKLKLRKGHDPLEVYVNNPKDTPAKDLKTVLYFPIQ